MAQISRSEFKRQIQQMDPERFEQFVGEIWSSRGWNTTLTSASYDRGIDVIASRNGVISRTEAIQVKRYDSEKISSPEVQQYGSIPYQEDDVDTVIIATSSSFSKPAQRTADSLNVKTVDGDGLYQIVNENSLFSVVAPYLESESESESEPEPEPEPDINVEYTTNSGHGNNTQSTRRDIRTQNPISTDAGDTETFNSGSSTQQTPDIARTLVEAIGAILGGFLIFALFIMFVLALTAIFT